jgi:2-desacetyl-2-hydroxyethyl bacteriochlorophyllide A dehydrogenase
VRTIILEKPGRLRAADTPEPGALPAGTALVRVRRIGVCGTDIHAFNGRQPFFSYPRILGHELGVEVLAIGPNDRGLKVGDRCAVEPYLNCGRCVACRRGSSNCCVNLQVLGVHTDGGMTERIAVPISKLHPSSRLTLEQLALVETLGIGAHAVQRAQIQAGEWALVLGAGPIGLSVIQFALAAGARVIVVDVNSARLEFCTRECGVTSTIDARSGDLIASLKTLTDDELPTVVFDATGNATSMMAAFDYPAHGGRLVFVGLFQGDVTFHDPNFHRRELTLLATRNALPDDFSRIITMIEAGKVDTSPWITHRAPLDAVPEILPRWVLPESGVLKAMIDVS